MANHVKRINIRFNPGTIEPVTSHIIKNNVEKYADLQQTYKRTKTDAYK